MEGSNPRSILGSSGNAAMQVNRELARIAGIHHGSKRRGGARDGSEEENEAFGHAIKQHMTLNDKRKRTLEDDKPKVDAKIRPLAVSSSFGGICNFGDT